MSTEDLTKEVKVERTEENNASNTQPLRPKDASTLLILDRKQDGSLHLLMGKRHMAHKFMPGKFVFPGGRVDLMILALNMYATTTRTFLPN